MCEGASATPNGRNAISSRHHSLHVAAGVLSLSLAFLAAAGAATLHRTAPAGAGAYLVKDTVPGSDESTPNRMVPVAGMLLFTAIDDEHGRELWRSDGTEAGTARVKDIWPGPENSVSWFLPSVGDTLFFMANDGTHGPALWKSDGTEAGTLLVKVLGSSPGSAAALGDMLLFEMNDAAHGLELWKSDGTESGTAIVKDIRPGPDPSDPSFLTAVGGTLFFAANDGVHGQELWKSDGTEAGTVIVRDAQPGGSASFPRDLTSVGSVLFYTARDEQHGPELWTSDGTEAGTLMVKDIWPGPYSSGVSPLKAVGDTLFFSAVDEVHGSELWTSDGTDAGTVMVKDINPGPYHSVPQDANSAVVGNTVFFEADDGVHGRELWSSDGTESGTVLVKEIRPGPWGAVPKNMTAVDGTLLFSAVDDVHGSELWKSDGTAAGTVMVQDVSPGESYSWSSDFASVGGTLFFAASEPAHGRELWAVGVPVALRLSPYYLRFGAVTSGGVVTVTTPTQRVEVNALTQPLSWAVSADEPWLKVTGGTGTGTGTFTVGLDASVLPLGGTGVEKGTVTIVTSGAVSRSQMMEVEVLLYPAGSTTEPTGSLDTPAEGATVSGAVAVTGWAVDDVAVDVAIYRDPVSGDPAGAISPNGKVYIGPANFVPGTRPDVESLFAGFPQARRSGWGQLLLTNSLPDVGLGTPVGGNGTFVLHAYASDPEGHTTLLGSASITADNANATRPFGTIDVPGEGESVSGTVVVFGWALTPPPAAIPTDGSTIWLVIDGALVDHPVYGQYRSDVAGLFPGYLNSNGAVGYSILDTTTLTNGMHTIAWSVTDNLGRVDGLGSRYFWVQN